MDPDTLQFGLDTQARPWLNGIEGMGHQQLGDWHGMPVFLLEDRGGQELRTWGRRIPGAGDVAPSARGVQKGALATRLDKKGLRTTPSAIVPC